MSLASFAIGSKDVVAASIVPSTAVLIISATSTNVIARSSAISSICETPTPTAAIEHGDRDHEVDPHVALRAQHVDDPLDRVVEALDDRRPRRSSVRAAPAPPSRRRGRSRRGGGPRARAARARRRRRPAGRARRRRAAAASPPARLAAVDREGERVGLLVDPEMVALQRADLLRRRRTAARARLLDALRARARARISSTAASTSSSRAVRFATSISTIAAYFRRCVPVSSACSL